MLNINYSLRTRALEGVAMFVVLLDVHCWNYQLIKKCYKRFQNDKFAIKLVIINPIEYKVEYKNMLIGHYLKIYILLHLKK